MKASFWTSAPSLVRTLDQLQKAGWIERVADAELDGLSAHEELALVGRLERLRRRLDARTDRAAGHLDWALFAGATLFQVEADLLQRPTYDDVYPYDELSITATPSTTVKESPTGFNVGGRLDYRFGRSRRFGAGVQVLYSTASVKLKAEPAASEARFDAGGLSVGAGLRVSF